MGTKIKVLVKERWAFGDMHYTTGDMIELTEEKFKVLVRDGVKLEAIGTAEPDKETETTEPDEAKKFMRKRITREDTGERADDKV